MDYSHVAGSSHHCLCQVPAVVQLLCDSEIPELDDVVILADEDVCRFDVSEGSQVQNNPTVAQRKGTKRQDTEYATSAPMKRLPTQTPRDGLRPNLCASIVHKVRTA